MTILDNLLLVLHDYQHRHFFVLSYMVNNSRFHINFTLRYILIAKTNAPAKAK